MSSVEKYTLHYTVDDYQQWKGDWELWQGFPVSMSPSPFGAHSKVLVNSGSALKIAIEIAGCDATALIELDWILYNDTVLRPDAIVVCGGAPERHLEAPPEIVIEILSDSTRERDQTYKRQFYQEQAVPYYLILDPDQNQLTALKLDAGKYSEMQITETLQLTICGDCNLEIPVASFFD